MTFLGPHQTKKEVNHRSFCSSVVLFSHRLVEGLDRREESPAVNGKSKLKAAKHAYIDLQVAARHAPSPDSPAQTVVSDIERHMYVALPMRFESIRQGSAADCGLQLF